MWVGKQVRTEKEREEWESARKGLRNHPKAYEIYAKNDGKLLML